MRLLDRLDRELGEGAGLIAIFDYDGTLTPLVSTPEAAVLAPSVRATLGRLAGSERARLAILSGRGLSDLKARVALDGVVYGGCHGLEIDGRHLRFRHPRARSSGIAATRRELTDALPALPGARLEFKGLSLALHYRGVRPERWPDVEEIAMLDCFSGGRIISGFVRGTAVESLHGGIDPSENFARFQEDSTQIPDALLCEQHLFVGLNHGSSSSTIPGHPQWKSAPRRRRIRTAARRARSRRRLAREQQCVPLRSPRPCLGECRDLWGPVWR